MEPVSGNGVTAIVPIHNEETALAAVLDGIDAQRRRPDEVILVFDRCTDGSEDLARGRGYRPIRVDVGNMARAVAKGCELATHDRLVIFDGNTLLPRDYIERLLQVHEEVRPDIVSWHGGLMLFTRSTLERFGPFSDLHLWTLEYFLRVEATGGHVVDLRGPFVRLKPSPLRRNVRYGLDYALLSEKYALTPFFRIGNKSGWLPDFVATIGAVVGHARAGRLGQAIRSLPNSLRAL